MNQESKRVAIIGGGITGLTIAYYLQKETLAKGLPIEYNLYELNNKLGGKIDTDYTKGFVIEKGPDSFLARKLSASKLAKEVGLEKELVYNDTGQSYVLKGNELYPIPGGAIMGIPTKIGPFATTKLFSPLGKVRAAADVFIPRTSDPNQDQSLGSFFRKRLGNEVVDNLIEPLLSGIYAGDIDRLSLMATFPQFHQVEQKHRSLILGMKKSIPKPPKIVQPAKPKGMFLSFKRGLSSFVDSIENHLDEDSVNKGLGVEKITQNADKSFEIRLTNGESETYDRVVVTTPQHVTRNMLREYDFLSYLEEMPSTSVATVALAFPLDKLDVEVTGTGFLVAKKSDYSITACTWTHKKWKHSTPEGYALLRCYVGRFGDDAIVNESDETILHVVLNDLKRTMNIEAPPEFYRITRWKESMPQYMVGHKQKIDYLKKKVATELQGLYVAGAPYEGLGLPDCIDQGEKVTEQILASLK
ncbi:protoporphyrinogen oxidase [Bacillus sp. FJAT-45350]|uniref:protoporphyrinogen oxidase n=1 Tax=Bacillus sp. FJAT-45350 TaxID=2011014 RepID=UPI000BB8E52F|nr:protoporphyrinogen oxidase [Bacillus sp. FJAT-45350]